MPEKEPYSRTYHRFPVRYPVIFGGAPFVGEGIISDLSLTGCSVACDRTVLKDTYIKLSVFLPDLSSSLLIELGKIRWVREHTFGVEFIRLPSLARQRLDGVVWEQLTSRLAARSQSGSRTV